tara:strand:- start:8708 stop:9217 length:510 start_codon:yes stop_codon:yes gene_type:complete
MSNVDRTRRIDLTKWKKMREMKTEKSTPRKLYNYELIKIEKNKQIKKKEENEKKKKRESMAFGNHVMLRLKHGDKGDVASIKIQRAFRSFMKDSDTKKKKYAESKAKELNNLMANFLRPKLKRSRTNDFNNQIPAKRTKRSPAKRTKQSPAKRTKRVLPAKRTKRVLSK